MKRFFIIKLTPFYVYSIFNGKISVIHLLSHRNPCKCKITHNGSRWRSYKKWNLRLRDMGSLLLSGKGWGVGLTIVGGKTKDRDTKLMRYMQKAHLNIS